MEKHALLTRNALVAYVEMESVGKGTVQYFVINITNQLVQDLLAAKEELVMNALVARETINALRIPMARAGVQAANLTSNAIKILHNANLQHRLDTAKIKESAVHRLGKNAARAMQAGQIIRTLALTELW